MQQPRWQVLHRTNDEGDWPEAWQIADTLAAGDPPDRYARGIGCDETLR